MPRGLGAPSFVALGGGARRHRPNRHGLHGEPVRARALRGGPAHRRGHPGVGRRRGRACRSTPRGSSSSGWARSTRASRATSTPKVAVGAAVEQRRGRAALDPARGLGRVALPDGVVRRRLLRGRGRDEGGPRGDRDRGRAGAPHRGARRAAARDVEDPPVLAALPLPGGRRRAHAAPARVHGRRLVHRGARSPSRSSASSAGASRSSRRCAARSATSTTTRCADPSGARAMTVRVERVRRGRRRARGSRPTPRSPSSPRPHPSPRRTTSRRSSPRRPRRCSSPETTRVRSSGC